MPRIKRWFPVNHDINRDQELWDLEAQYGPKVVRVWLELLSIADRNDGEIPGSLDTIAKQVAWQVRLKSAKCRTIIGAISDRQWVDIGETIIVRNFWKYHRSPEQKQSPSEPPLPSEPSEPLKDAARTPVLVEKKIEKEPRKLDADIKAAADPIYKSNPEKFSRLIVWIKDREKRDYPSEVITTTLRLYWQQEQKTKVADWWPYLNRIFTKEFGRWNEEQSAKHKAADSSFVRNLVHATAGVMKA